MAIQTVIKRNIKEADLFYNSPNFYLLLEKLIIQYSKKIQLEGKKFVLLIVPQKYDLEFKKVKKNNYEFFFSKLSKKINILDLTDDFFSKKNFKDLYLDDKYAGHLSRYGNKFVSAQLFKYLKRSNVI